VETCNEIKTSINRKGEKGSNPLRTGNRGTERRIFGKFRGTERKSAKTTEVPTEGGGGGVARIAARGPLTARS